MVLLPVFYAKVYLIPHDNLNGSLRSIQYPGCIGYCENLLCTRLSPVSAAIARVPRLFSAVGKNAKKSRRRKLQMRYPETTPRPGVAVTFTRSAWGILPLPQLTSREDNSFTRLRSRFRSKLKLHFQKAIFTRKCSTSEQN